MEALDKTFQEAIDSKRVPGVAALALDASGKVLFSKGYGTTNISDPEAAPMTTETSSIIFSCSKLVTSIAALQLVEQGKLDLDAPAEKYVPEIAEIQLLTGFDDNGQPTLKTPAKKITVLNLFTHTSGFSYDFFDHDTFKYRMAKGQPPVSYSALGTKEIYSTPLMFEPGSAYKYGVNIDWLGMIIEQISGLRLDDYVDKYIVQPLGLKNTGSKPSSAQFFLIHTKDAEGNLSLMPPQSPPEHPEVVGGGAFLFSTCADYTQILLTIANKGTHPTSKVTILKPETVDELLFTDMLPRVGCKTDELGEFAGPLPPVASAGTFLPGIKKGHSCGMLINNEPLLNGRSKGSGAWAGLGNSYYWVDPVAGKLGIVISSFLPFMDKDVLHLADALERAVYDKPAAKEAGEEGSNFKSG